MSTPEQAERQRAELRARWDAGAAGWGRRADEVRRFGMPVSAWMLDRLALQPGQVVLELAAGPGDTGLMAAELVAPGGELICSDASEEMLAIARRRARQQGIGNVRFRRLELEWIDLDAASVDAIACRWGLMFALDAGAALQEMRRVLRPGGRLALAVWDSVDHNPWARIPTEAAVLLGHEKPPDPAAPNMFSLGDRRILEDLLRGAGFLDLELEAVELRRSEAGIGAFLASTLDLSRPFAELRERLSEEGWQALQAKIAELAEPFTGPDGSLAFPARALAAAAVA